MIDQDFINNEIGTGTWIHGNVKMGIGNKIGRAVIIENGVQIGDYNVIRDYAVIGTPAEKHGVIDIPSEYGVKIGHRNHISEFVTIHGGASSQTTIGDQNTILTKAHIGHDSIVANWCTISCAVLVGGHSHIEEGANLGLGAILHQFSRIGAYAMVGMGTVVKSKQRIIPGCTYVGVPARFVKMNTIGVQRSGVSQDALQKAIELYHHNTNGWKKDV